MQIMQILEINATMNMILAFVPMILPTTQLPLKPHKTTSSSWNHPWVFIRKPGFPPLACSKVLADLRLGISEQLASSLPPFPLNLVLLLHATVLPRTLTPYQLTSCLSSSQD